MPFGTITSMDEVTGVILIKPVHENKDLFVYQPECPWPHAFAVGQKIRYDSPLSPGGRLARNVRVLDNDKALCADCK